MQTNEPRRDDLERHSSTSRIAERLLSGLIRYLTFQAVTALCRL